MVVRRIGLFAAGMVHNPVQETLPPWEILNITCLSWPHVPRVADAKCQEAQAFRCPKRGGNGT